MRVAFIHRGGPVMASYRYRCLIPADSLNQMNGYQVKINEAGEYDTVIFSKPMSEDVTMAKSVKEQGGRVIVDIGDDHLTHPIIGPVYTEMLQLADTLVSPTQEMAERVYRVSGKSPLVIPDPFEFPEAMPHAMGNKLLWFGHQNNLKDLKAYKNMLGGWDLTIVTGPDKREGALLWSQESLMYALAQANVVMIPVRKGHEFKSNNRLLNAVRAGCFVVCSQQPSHEEFGSTCWVGPIKAGLDWAKAFQGDLNGLVRQAQQQVTARYHPTVIAQKWAEVLG